MHKVERHEPLSFAQEVIKTNPLAAICGKDPASTTGSTRVGGLGHWARITGRPAARVFGGCVEADSDPSAHPRKC